MLRWAGDYLPFWNETDTDQGVYVDRIAGGDFHHCHHCLNQYVDGHAADDHPIRLASVSRAGSVVWMFDSKNLPAVGGWSYVHTNLHGSGAQFLFLDGHVARFRNTAYWNFETNTGRTNNPALVWMP